MLLQIVLTIYGIKKGIEFYKNAKKENRNPILEADQKYQAFIQNKIDSFFDKSRSCQQKSLSSTGDFPKIGRDEKNANRLLGIASGNLLFAITSNAFYPRLLFLCIPSILLFNLKAIKDTFKTLLIDRRVSSALIDGVVGVWFLSSGYYFAGSLSIFMIALYRKILSKTKENSEKQLIDVFIQRPRNVWIVLECVEVEIPFEDLKIGDVVVVNGGEPIPADGVVLQGQGIIDQRMLTGESLPTEKDVGDHIFASSILLAGKIHVRVQKTGEETVAGVIGKILNNTTEYKTTMESKSESISDQMTLPTLCLSLLAYPVGGSSSSLAILYSSVGYNMRILGPLSSLKFLNIAAQSGILIKDAGVFERLSEIDMFVFDKTGTLTETQPSVYNLITYNGTSKEIIASYAAAAEYKQTHPIAKAIIQFAQKEALAIPVAREVCCEIGYGIRAEIDGKTVRVGSRRFMEKERIEIPCGMEKEVDICEQDGRTIVMVSCDNEMLGGIVLSSKVRPEVKQVIKDIHQENKSTCIISGDYLHPTRSLATELGIKNYYAETLPEQKAEIIMKLQKEGKKVCFIGDGINDTIALKKADISISLCGATTAAVDCAQVILMNEDMTCLTKLLQISKEFDKCQKRNMIICIVPGALSIGGVFLLHFGLYSSMLFYYSGLIAGIRNALRKEKIPSLTTIVSHEGLLLDLDDEYTNPS